MKKKGKKDGTVFGVYAPGPKLTRAGMWFALRWIVLPFLGLLLLLDVAGFLIARFVFDSCYGVLCLLS